MQLPRPAPVQAAASTPQHSGSGTPLVPPGLQAPSTISNASELPDTPPAPASPAMAAGTQGEASMVAASPDASPAAASTAGSVLSSVPAAPAAPPAPVPRPRAPTTDLERLEARGLVACGQVVEYTDATRGHAFAARVVRLASGSLGVQAGGPRPASYTSIARWIRVMTRLSAKELPAAKALGNVSASAACIFPLTVVWFPLLRSWWLANPLAANVQRPCLPWPPRPVPHRSPAQPCRLLPLRYARSASPAAGASSAP